ncbi:hypothetical protein RFY44_05770 [Acinetobacter bereziniae]|uniref:hypothetical protein n=1 Tax=Acinetobacter TaxID=469 RepID=UPI0004F56BF2|nr:MULTISPECIES: hypothetical protein [Acinetobacter]MCM8510880.1 hypothetical protein [Acinetobacter bereziniae]MDQ9818388.1 hypothetical protein [Acinetobacter bereziniae]
MDWLREKLWQLDDFRRAFPSVFWSSYILILLVIASAMLYFPALSNIANLEILNTKPLYSMVLNNLDTLKWGIIVVPMIVALLGWNLIDDLYQRKLKRLCRY